MISGEASVTAKICAFARAHHSKCGKEIIYDDYYAYDLLGEEEYNNVKNEIIKILSQKCWEIPTLDTWDGFINELISPIILARMKFAETKLEEFNTDENEDIQYVICGAGLDSFMFRNKHKNIDVFELDHIDTQNYKKERIKKLNWNISENTKLISIDFEKQNIKDVLLDAGFNPEKKSFFAILGVTYYLTLDTFAETLKSISEVAKGESQIVFDYPDKDIVKRGVMNNRMSALEDITSALGEEMKGGMNYRELAKKLNEVGFHISDYVTSQVIQEKYLDARYDDLKAYENVNFVLAEKNILDY